MRLNLTVISLLCFPTFGCFEEALQSIENANSKTTTSQTNENSDETVLETNKDENLDDTTSPTNENEDSDDTVSQTSQNQNSNSTTSQTNTSSSNNASPSQPITVKKTDALLTFRFPGQKKSTLTKAASIATTTSVVPSLEIVLLRDNSIAITFGKDIDGTTITNKSVQLRRINDDGTLTEPTLLFKNTTYRATVESAANTALWLPPKVPTVSNEFPLNPNPTIENAPSFHFESCKEGKNCYRLTLTSDIRFRDGSSMSEASWEFNTNTEILHTDGAGPAQVGFSRVEFDQSSTFSLKPYLKNFGGRAINFTVTLTCYLWTGDEELSANTVKGCSTPADQANACASNVSPLQCILPSADYQKIFGGTGFFATFVPGQEMNFSSHSNNQALTSGVEYNYACTLMPGYNNGSYSYIINPSDWCFLAGGSTNITRGSFFMK